MMRTLRIYSLNNVPIDPAAFLAGVIILYMTSLVLIYLVNGNLTQITRDHSYVQHLVDIGQITVKEAENASIKNIIIRSIGNEKKANPDLFTIKLTPDSYILLCSDGLTNCLDNDTIVKNISASTKEELASCVDNLINLANNAGGPDNITVILGKI